MAGLWSDILQEGSYDGVRFDFVSAKDEIANDIDKQELPNKDGARLIGRGRKARRFDVMAIFIEGDYPEQLDKLIAAVDNGGKVKKFVHPIFGEFNAACERGSISHDADDAGDSATMSLTFIEDNDSERPTAVRNTTPALANNVRSVGDSVLVALSTFQATLEVENTEIGLAVTGAVNTASSVADSLEATGDTLPVLDIQATANGALAACDEALVLLADFDSIEGYELSSGVQEMASGVRDLAQELIDQRPPLSVYSVPAATNLLALAHALGADAEELLTLNSFPDPSAIPAGFEVRAYAE